MKVKSALNVEMMYTALVVDRGAVRLYTCWARGGAGGHTIRSPAPTEHTQETETVSYSLGRRHKGWSKAPPQCAPMPYGVMGRPSALVSRYWRR